MHAPEDDPTTTSDQFPQQSRAEAGASAGIPTENNLGNLIQFHLEASNVDPVTELVSLIETQRAFEMNSQSLKTADEMLQSITNLRRF